MQKTNGYKFNNITPFIYGIHKPHHNRQNHTVVVLNSVVNFLQMKKKKNYVHNPVYFCVFYFFELFPFKQYSV